MVDEAGHYTWLQLDRKVLDHDLPRYQLQYFTLVLLHLPPGFQSRPLLRTREFFPRASFRGHTVIFVLFRMPDITLYTCFYSFFSSFFSVVSLAIDLKQNWTCI